MVGGAGIDHHALGTMHDPSLVFEFVLELPFRPAGIAHKGADLETLHLVHHGFLCGKMGRVLQLSILLRPAERRKGEMLRAHRTAHEYGNVGEPFADLPGQHVGAEEFPHLLPEGPVEDIAESTTLAAVLGEEEHAAEKSRLTQTRIGQDQTAFE